MSLEIAATDSTPAGSDRAAKPPTPKTESPQTIRSDRGTNADRGRSKPKEARDSTGKDRIETRARAHARRSPPPRRGRDSQPPNRRRRRRREYKAEEFKNPNLVPRSFFVVATGGGGSAWGVGRRGFSSSSPAGCLFLFLSFPFLFLSFYLFLFYFGRGMDPRVIPAVDFRFHTNPKPRRATRVTG